MKPTSEILERINKCSTEHKDGVFTRLYRYLLREDIYYAAYQKGNCILLDDGDGCVCPQRISYSVCCRWFRNAVLPVSPELEADIFKDATLRQCVSCGARYVPGSNRSRFCPACAAERRRQKDRERKQRTRHTVRI